MAFLIKSTRYLLLLNQPQQRPTVSYCAVQNLMSMNNIAICLLCLLIIPKIVIADSDLDAVCKDFRADIESTASSNSPNQTPVYDKGLLWKIETSEGKTNYLFGTIHSQDSRVSVVSPLVRGALMQSKVLIMETIPDQTANQAFLEKMNFNDGQQLDQLLEAETFNALAKQIQNYGVDNIQVKRIKPWAAFSIIGRPEPIRAPTLESNLLQIAHQNKLELKSLETMEEILNALDSLSTADQLIILKDTICNHEKIIKDTENLIQLYINGDLAGMVAFNQQAHYDEAVFKRFMQRILYDRNSRMLNRIEKEFTAGNVFVAVGASHLIEDKGLLNQLRIKGYTLTPVY